MGAPNLTITVEPFELSSVAFLPLAAKTNHDTANAQLALKLSIKNNEAKKVRVDLIHVSFKKSGASGSAGPKDFSVKLKIPAGASTDWWNDPDKNIILPFPAPAVIELALSCDGFDKPATVAFPLLAHKSPTSAGSYHFPANATELRGDEYWQGASSAHWSGGDQLFAYDLNVAGWDSTNHTWTNLLPGKKGDKNADYRVYGKSIYAMADGTVVDFRSDLPDNPNPGSFPATVIDYAGNHFYLQHGD